MRSIKRTEIEAMIPHSGNMCLLDAVVSWDDKKIHCVSSSHLDKNNPLAIAGHLPALCGIEYAAQAMALHGGLTGVASSRPRAGYLASLRDVNCLREYLDDLSENLSIHAEQLMGDEARVIYEFTVSAGDTKVLNGRATVVLDVDGVM